MKPVSVSVSVNGNTIECETETDHLAHSISSQDSDNFVKSANNIFCRGFNLLAAEFGHTHDSVKCKLFKQYCYSFYNSSLWVLHGKGFTFLCVAWRKALRMLWRVHLMKHYDIIATMSEMLPLEIQLNWCFAKIVNQFKSFESQIVQMINKVESSKPMFPVGKHIKNVNKVDLVYNQ